MNQSTIAFNRAIMASAGLALGAATTASAGVIPLVPPGNYPMLNHPDGSAALPEYGLRLDNLRGSGIYTFDLEAPGVGMVLTITDTGAGTYRINMDGTAFGGLDVGGSYSADPNDTSEVEVHFEYLLAAKKSDDDDLIVLESVGSGSGTIEWLDTGDVYSLAAENQGNTFFRLGDEDHDNGHRNYSGVSGWGWMDYDGLADGVGDWLFTLPDPIPTPATSIAVFGALALSGRRRRG